MTRKQPDFNERAYGYANFGELLEDARTLGLLKVERDARAGGTWVVQGLGEGLSPRGHAAARQRQGPHRPATPPLRPGSRRGRGQAPGRGGRQDRQGGEGRQGRQGGGRRPHRAGRGQGHRAGRLRPGQGRQVDVPQEAVAQVDRHQGRAGQDRRAGRRTGAGGGCLRPGRRHGRAGLADHEEDHEEDRQGEHQEEDDGDQVDRQEDGRQEDHEEGDHHEGGGRRRQDDHEEDHVAPAHHQEDRRQDHGRQQALRELIPGDPRARAREGPRQGALVPSWTGAGGTGGTGGAGGRRGDARRTGLALFRTRCPGFARRLA